jgi:hypothetical protein
MFSGYNQAGLEWNTPTFQALSSIHFIPSVLIISYSRYNYIVVQNIAGKYHFPWTSVNTFHIKRFLGDSSRRE